MGDVAMTSEWVDFKTVCEKLNFVGLLFHYGLEKKALGNGAASG